MFILSGFMILVGFIFGGIAFSQYNPIEHNYLVLARALFFYAVFMGGAFVAFIASFKHKP